MNPRTPVIVWFRQDLRLTDNPALASALRTQLPIVFVYVWSENDRNPWAMGSASRWWLHQSLIALEAQLRTRGNRLVIRQGQCLPSLQTLIKETGAVSIYWNRRYEPMNRAEDRQTYDELKKMGLTVHECHGTLLMDPERLQNKTGSPYRVFTPFWKRYLSEKLEFAHSSVPKKLPALAIHPHSIPLEQLGLEPTIDWTSGMRAVWTPGEAGSRSKLKQFVSAHCASYEHDRDRPDHDHTSQLSPHLCFGEMSPQTVWRTLSTQLTSEKSKTFQISASAFLRQIVWRDFAYHLLHHYPHTPTQPLRQQFAHFKWDENPLFLKSWQRGKTGYPFVDAGMRQLWAIGWMHNRVRMVAASFLSKHLLQPWQHGAEWFWDTLVDADLANNTLGWQWVAGCGADAAPYFRIFNPIVQGEKFDPDGNYIRRWVPELQTLPTPWIHKPWETPPLVLAEHGITLGQTYPYPIVDHQQARDRALMAFASLKKGTSLSSHEVKTQSC